MLFFCVCVCFVFICVYARVMAVYAMLRVCMYVCVVYMHVSTSKQTSHGSFVPVLSPDWRFDWAEGYDVTTWKYFDGHKGTGGS